MSDFLDKVENIKNKISESNHKGNERQLQEYVLKALRSTEDIFYFSTNKKINNCSVNQCGYGLELGFKINQCQRFVDISLATIEKTGGNTSNVKNLCEIKVINPKKYSFKGRWYKYFYHYECCPITFDFLQNLGPEDQFGKIVTDADEGQIIFDLIKMIAYKNILNNTNVEMYQIIAIKTKLQSDNFDSCKAKLMDVLTSWIKHCEINKGDNAEIYEWEDFVKQDHGSQKPALVCCLPDSLRCSFVDLGCADYFQHILINWQPEDSKVEWNAFNS